MLSERDKTILDGIRRGRRMLEISEDLGLSKQRISQIVQELAADGYLTEIARGRYRVSSDVHEFRSKQKTRAFRWNGETDGDLEVMLGGQFSRWLPARDAGEDVVGLEIFTTNLKKKIVLSPGWWMVQLGDFSWTAMSPEDFTRKYEVV